MPLSRSLRRLGLPASVLLMAAAPLACDPGEAPPAAAKPAATASAATTASGAASKVKATEAAIATAAAYGPFTASVDANPPASVYAGPLYKVAHAWPSTPPPAPPASPPWTAALGGAPISGKNALAYVEALKAYVTPAMRTLVFDYAKYDGDALGYYASPWLAPYSEPIHGTYVGSGFAANTFPKSGLAVDMSTYVLSLYDKTAAYTLNQIWGLDATKFNATPTSGQFAEGSVVVKAALTTACGTDWPPIAGAQAWPIYAPLDPFNGSGQGNTACPNNGSAGKGNENPVLTNVYLFQFDIIVKDTQTAPKTGWVFSTLVYDGSAPGADAWDKMIPLGAMWGNDPGVDSTKNPAAPLAENWINPKAPVYATETLGWGGRLSGPNDGAVIAPASVDGKQVANLPASSCMSCHLTAEYPMKSFLLPSPPADAKTPPDPTVNGDAIVVYPPGGKEWSTWFQDLAGNVAKDEGSIAFDYDMNTVFKALPAYEKAAATDRVAALRELRTHARVNGRYHGTVTPKK